MGRSSSQQDDSMPLLHVDEYTRALAGKEVFIACREGILRYHFSEIVTDIKFLTRQGVHTTLLHNMANRFANQKHFRELSDRLQHTRIVRAPADRDFYTFVLDCQDHIHKLIFLERKYLIDPEGRKINALTTRDALHTLGSYADLIANKNFKDVLERICHKIEEEKIDRVHILPAGRNAIKHELFTVEGSGTLIANNFTETLRKVRNPEEVRIVTDILNKYKKERYLISRSGEYISDRRDSFYVTVIDGIIVGCVEKKELDHQTVELGALAISTKFRNQRVGVFTINAFVEKMKENGFRRFVSLTNNPNLQKLFLSLGFVQETRPEYRDRQASSPDVKMFFKQEV